jgi:nitrite reductase/ring-hydroxylating ferredoxin subunit
MSALHQTIRSLERLGGARRGRPARDGEDPPSRSPADRAQSAQRDISWPPLAPHAHRRADRCLGDAALLDAVGGRAVEPTADLLVKVGAVAALPTAAAGLNDWSDTDGPAKRVGLVHGTANTLALSLYMGSLVARGRGNRSGGKVLGLSGFRVLLVGGHLGGHLSYRKGVNVNRTAWEEGPREWTPVLADSELGDDEHRRVHADGEPLLLYRRPGQLHALAATCSHMGGPLDEGTIAHGSVTCPWHGSIFRLRHGSVCAAPPMRPSPATKLRSRPDASTSASLLRARDAV